MDKKKLLNQVDTIIFDFDGTIFNGRSLSLPIYKECLEKLSKKFNLESELPSESKILEQFGKQTPALYYSLLETSNEDMIKFLGDCVESAEVRAFSNNKGSLYPNVLETLKELKNRGYKLAICTNARSDYFEAAAKRFELQKYFDLLSAAGNYLGKDKV
ncbi:MAG: HAD family hydrolase, partial [Candidatus Hodarchaeales archaeon]